jgi:hypothetical protein
MNSTIFHPLHNFYSVLFRSVFLSIDNRELYVKNDGKTISSEYLYRNTILFFLVRISSPSSGMFEAVITENGDFKNYHQPTNRRIHNFNTYRMLHFSFIDQFLTQSKGCLGVCWSIRNQFPISNWISREVQKEKISEKYVHVFRWKLWEVYTLDCNLLVCFISKKIKRK